MCGICGVLNMTDGKRSPIDIRAMTDKLQHRGPDGKGFYEDEYVSFGSVRLKVIDLENGSQPVSNMDESIIAIFNGEIYNFMELKKDLINKGYSLKTNCDTEIIPYMYEEYGIDFVQFLRGMFAIALYDKKNRTTYLIRDRVGIKPLYYHVDKNTLIFASEIKSIYESGEVERAFDYYSLNYYFKMGVVPAPRTAYKGIYKVRPGSYLKFTKEKIEEKQYWSYPVGEISSLSKREEQNKTEEFYALLNESVRIRMITDTSNIACYLSGGIDSSSVSYFMQKNSSTPIVNYNFTFSGKSNMERDESYYSRLMAESNGSEYVQLTYSESSFELMEKALYYLEEPTINFFNAQSFYQMSQRVKQNGTTVVLMGEGSDELFGGYYFNLMEKIRAFSNRHEQGVLLYKRLPGRQEMSREGCRQYYNLHNQMASFIVEDLGAYFPYLTEPYLQRNYILSKQFIELYRFNEAIDTKDIFASEPGGIPFEEERMNDIYSRLTDYIIPTREKMNMANAVECRFPFLDHKLIEFVFRMPQRVLLKGLNTKSFLKETMKSHLPAEIIKRPKHGLALAGELDMTSHYLLSEESINQSNLFNYEKLSQIINAYKAAEKPYLKFSLSTIIERVLCVQVLYNLFIKNT